MKNRIKLIVLIIATSLIVGATGCSHREAATVGAMVGRRIGTVFGTAAVAVEETFETATDVRNANPRWDHQTQRNPSSRNNTQQASTTAESQHHYYSTNVVIKTRGPADILSVEASDSKDVTRFWGQ